MDVSTTNSRFRLPRTVEEESALVSEARPSSTKYKDKWAVEIFGKGREHEISGFGSWKRFQRLRLSPRVFCRGQSGGYGCFIIQLLACLIYPGGGKKGGRYPPRMLYGIVCCLKRHLEEVRGASALNRLDYKDKR